MKTRSFATTVLSLLCVSACVEPSAATAAGMPASETDLARFGALKSAFLATDWTALADAAFSERNTHVHREVTITPPGESFAAWMFGGTIDEQKLDELLATVESRLTALVAAEDVTIERRYPADEVPPLVIQAIWFDDEEHPARRKGYGFALRSGAATAHIEVIAMPYRDGWRIDGHLREPVTGR